MSAKPLAGRQLDEVSHEHALDSSTKAIVASASSSRPAATNASI